MLKQDRISLIIIVLVTMFLVGCAKKDLTINLGKGDSIRIVGEGDSFDCDDPAYAGIERVQTWTMQFADGSIKYLCAPKDSIAKSNPAPPAPQPPVAAPNATGSSAKQLPLTPGLPMTLPN